MSDKEQQTKPDGGASVSTAGLGGCGFPDWAKIGKRVVSSVHGPGTITNMTASQIGVHWDSNYRDRMTDCWYSDAASNGRYTSGHGIDLLTPNSACKAHPACRGDSA